MRAPLLLILVSVLAAVGCTGVEAPDLMSESALSSAGAGSDGAGSSSTQAPSAPVSMSDLEGAEDDCEPVVCEAGQCGRIPDGCGDLLDCGGCGDGEQCGLQERNVCTVLKDLCEPLSKEDACADRECGVVSDGCEGSHRCGSCGDGEQCGLFEPHACGKKPVDNPDVCDAEIKSCSAVGAECGTIGNGCGGTLDCDAELGGCPDGTFCGLGGPQKCGEPESCEPLPVAEVCAGKCGMVADGCGGLADCDADEAYRCPEGTACGASGVPNVCGAGTPSDCIPTPAAQACGTAVCGLAGDGCGGVHACGSCDADERCTAGACEALCVPLSAAEACQDAECGLVGDGCGDTLRCGSCPDSEVCGAITPYQCSADPQSQCQALSPEQACDGKSCGIVLDGCGDDESHRIDCAGVSGGCPAGTYCGVDKPFQCDVPEPPPCTPAGSCAALGWECGMAVDSCGNVYDCAAEGRTCSSLESCLGGVTSPALCVTGGGGPGDSDECPLCGDVPQCSSGQVTQLSGRVVTPGKSASDVRNQVGVPNAFVYILQQNDLGVLPGIDSGLLDGGQPITRCDRCAEQDLGPVLVSATTDATGAFTLRGSIPVGSEFVLVVKVGKWRRAQRMTLPTSAACRTTSVDYETARLPRHRSDGLAVSIPHFAVVTGAVDAMECVLWKMGVSSSEFALPNSVGDNAESIHMYASNAAPGAGMPGGLLGLGSATVSESRLLDTDARLNAYDVVVFDCEGGANERSSSIDRRVRSYINRGGRVFASHYSYTYLHDNGTDSYNPQTAATTGLSQTARWGGATLADSGTGVVSVGRPNANDQKIGSFLDWLVTEGAVSYDAGQARYEFTIQDPRDYALAVNPPSEEWVYWDQGLQTSVQQFSFNTPFGAPESASCGRVAYSGFHVAGNGIDSFAGQVFPNHCSGTRGNGGNLTAQEKVLLYMLFDLSTCVSEGPPPPPQCMPLSSDSCDDNSCGLLPDGCGGTIDCGVCEDGFVCGQNNTCVPVDCAAATCSELGATCGTVQDGCGTTLNCGLCEDGQVCGLFVANQCGPVCTPADRESICDGGTSCGYLSDGCGGVVDCGGCAEGLTCVQNRCEDQSCTPTDSCPVQVECGQVSDGCSGTLSCGECQLPETCGGGGTPNQCGRPQCDPLSCGDLNAECGFVGDGCGGSAYCGDCPPGQTCGLLEPNRCGGCQPRSCADAAAECGLVGDGCGGVVDCGDCTGAEICGALVANQCDEGPECQPLACADSGAECGLIGDGCGDSRDCGACPPGEVCGILSPNQCDPPPPCTPTDCEAEGAECGAIGDGCGGLLDCGGCKLGESCGFFEPNQCGGLG